MACRLRTLLCCLALALVSPFPAWAQEFAAAAPPDVADAAMDPDADGTVPDEAGAALALAADDARHADEAHELGLWLDGAVAALLRRGPIPGLVVSVVRDGRVVLARGYGLDRVEPARAADGERSLFRIGSTSKTFTYTAAMQLVERGRMALEDPVNQHLPEAIQVPDDGFSEPVRIRHLLSHSAGFEDTALGHLFQHEPERVLSLQDYLARHRPRRVRAPDTAAVYSNYSVALLGAVVAQVSGLSFEEYVEQHLTGPLGMDRATFREPLTAGDPRRLDPALAADIATGYRRSAGAFQAAPFEYIAHGAPAGGASASAADMARWMLVHLNGGELDGVRILAPDTARQMRGILFRNAPAVSGVAHGFMTEQLGPRFAYGHGGATLNFHTGMLLLPDTGLGVFVSANTAEARAPVGDLVRLIVARLQPDTAPELPSTVAADEPLDRFEGRYRGNRRAYHSAEMAVRGLMGDVRVLAPGDGSLRLMGGGQVQRLLQVAPLVFQDADSHSRLQFLVDDRGAITGFAHGSGIVVFERVGVLAAAPTLYLLLALVALTALLRLWRSRRQDRRHPPRPGLRLVRALAIASALVWLAFIGVALAAGVTIAGEGSAAVVTYPSRLLLWALALATLAALLTAIEVLALVPVWRSRWRASAKLTQTLGTVLLALTAYVLWTWNLLGMRT